MSSLPLETTSEDEAGNELLFEGTVDELNARESNQSSPLGSPLARPSTSFSCQSEEVNSSKRRKKQPQVNSQAVVLMEKATALLEKVSEPVQPTATLDIIDAFLG